MDNQTALRLALGDFRIAMPPEIAERVAAASLRLAASCWCYAQAQRNESQSQAGLELIMLLADGIDTQIPPDVAAQLAALHAAPPATTPADTTSLAELDALTKSFTTAADRLRSKMAAGA